MAPGAVVGGYHDHLPLVIEMSCAGKIYNSGGLCNQCPRNAGFCDKRCRHISHSARPALLSRHSSAMVSPLRIDKGCFVDPKGRSVQLKGINVDAGSKYPRTPLVTSHSPAEGKSSVFFEGDTVSFVNRPFPLEEAHSHLRRIKGLGYNVIRYIFTWEALEHAGPGNYDEDFIKYTVELLRLIHEDGELYVFLDPHQDVWNRHCGGDGAPMWTLYAAGLDPRGFDVTEAAILQNYFPQDPDSYPKMLWTTNYHRLATCTMFTLFFAGKVFAPKCIIDGVNIQDYLQNHFIDAVAHFLARIKQLAPETLESTLLGIETMNEPNHGFLCIPDIAELPATQNLKLGTTPSAFQAMKLGMGIATEVDEYEISVFGPRKTGSTLIDPEGATAWLQQESSMDSHYGFDRDPGWKLGRCIWEMHGVWDSETTTALINNYFSVHPVTGDVIDIHYFTNEFFVHHYEAYRKAVRNVLPSAFLFLEPPVLQVPPRLIGTTLVDDKTVFCPHYYDGMSLMFKTWNKRYNVDTLGIMRGRYSNPVFGIVFGETNIRNSFRRQLAEMKAEGEENLGNVPVLFSEIGMPFDMDKKRAFEEDDFVSQTSALDALGYALEGSNLSHTWWCYASDNCHKWGDRFNCEDFSFWSIDDDLDESTLPGSRDTSSVLAKKHFSERLLTLDSDSTSGTLAGSRTNLRIGSYKAAALLRAAYNKAYLGLRAIDAVIRPYPLALNGEFIDAVFDLKNLTYTLKLIGNADMSKPTRIHFPDWHFFTGDDVLVSSGSYKRLADECVLEWLHEPGEQTLEIKAEGASPPASFLQSFLSSCCL